MFKNSSDGGHLSNLTNLEKLHSISAGYGDKFRPSKAHHQLSFMQFLSAEARENLSQLKTVRRVANDLIGDRERIFDTVQPLVSRIVSALEYCDAPPNVLREARSINRKLLGLSAKAKKDPPPATPAAGEPEKKTKSDSQTSFDRQVDFFDMACKIVVTVPEYTPVEEDLSPDYLQKLLAELVAINTKVVDAKIVVSNVLIRRNVLFYKPFTGIVAVGKGVKKYIRSIFGLNSPEYQLVVGLEFKNIKL